MDIRRSSRVQHKRDSQVVETRDSSHNSVLSDTSNKKKRSNKTLKALEADNSLNVDLSSATHEVNDIKHISSQHPMGKENEEQKKTKATILSDLSNEVNVNFQSSEIKEEIKEENKHQYKGYGKLSLFEQLRLKNIAENEKFLKEIDLTAQTSVLAPPPAPKKFTKTVPKRIEKVVYTDEPRRESARLKNKPVQPIYVESDLVTNQRYIEPKVTIAPHVIYNGSLNDAGSSSNYEELKSCLQNVAAVEKSERPDSITTNALLEKLSLMKVNDKDVARSCQGRIYDAKFHPANSKILLATGDKYGNIGFWDVDAEKTQGSKSNGCFLRQPHTLPVRCLKFSSNDFSKFFTCSFDGTLKCVDLNKCEFTTVCNEKDLKFTHQNYPDRNGFHWFDFMQDGTSLCIGEELGHVVIVDPRSPDEAALTFVNGMKPVKCVSTHPTKPYLIAADYLGVKVWDVRNVKKRCIEELFHGRVAHGAFFSPLTGDKILTTCSDDYIRVFDSSVIATGSIKVALRLRHDNHTGRWLAPFQAIWHPRNEDVFVVGSMDGARKLEVFTTDNVTSRPTLEMKGNDSICCRNAFHPSLDVFAGTTSSGKAFIWR